MIINGIGPNRSQAKPDSSLIKLIVKAHMLHDNLMSGNLGIAHIAKSHGVHHSYVSRLIRLATGPTTTPGLKPIQMKEKR